MNISEFLRIGAAAAGGWLWAAICPAIPCGAVCTAMVVADIVTARRLARRLSKAAPERSASLRFSSTGLGRAIATISRIYALLVLAAMVGTVVLGNGRLLQFATGAVCFWQGVSILENEAACNGAAWARIARRVLIDKTERYLGITLDELKNK